MRFNATAVLVLLLLQVFLPAHSDELRPLGHEDIWTMNRLGSPVVDPSGEYAVVSVTEPSYEEDGDVSDLWLLPGGPTAPRSPFQPSAAKTKSARSTCWI